MASLQHRVILREEDIESRHANAAVRVHHRRQHRHHHRVASVHHANVTARVHHDLRHHRRHRVASAVEDVANVAITKAVVDAAKGRAAAEARVLWACHHVR